MKSNKISVSIALATFNGESFIEEQLLSIQNQTYLPEEVIICDDCSTDNTISVIHRIRNRLRFDIHLIENPVQLGYSQNFSKALSLCTKDFVFICDQDDYWLPNKIEYILNKFEIYKEKNLIIHNLEFCDEKLVKSGQDKVSRFRNKENLMHGYVTGMASAIRLSFLKKSLPIPNKKFIEYDTWLHHLAYYSNTKLVVNEILALYRRHDQNVTKESALNRKYKFSWIRNKLYHFKQNTKKSLENIIKRDEELLRNLQYKESFLKEKLIKRIYFTKIRYDYLSNKIRLIRFFYILNYYIKGDYSLYGGLNSALKDLMIR